MKRLIPIFLCILLLLSCQKGQDAISPEELARQDSLALHVAVMPVIDCLPLYYASRMGIFDSLGVDVRLRVYMAQMDCDTAILNHRAEVAYADLARLLEMQGDSLPLRAIAATRGGVSLLTAKKVRIRNLKNLNERMVALNRLSQSDYWSDELMRQAGLEQSAIYRPQINDIRLRTSMLIDQLVDGALLPEPYATLAELKGHRRVFTTNDSAPSFTCLAIRSQLLSDKRVSGQVSNLIKGYNKAVEALNSYPQRDSLRAILTQDFAVPTEVADTAWHFLPCSAVRESNVKTAYDWLRKLERRISQAARDSLVSHHFIP